MPTETRKRGAEYRFGRQRHRRPTPALQLADAVSGAQTILETMATRLSRAMLPLYWNQLAAACQRSAEGSTAEAAVERLKADN